MKFLLVARNPSIFIQYEHVIRKLIAEGHCIKFHLVSRKWRNARVDTKILSDFREMVGANFDYCDAETPVGLGATLLKHKREVVNYAAYFAPKHPISISPYMSDRQRQALHPPMDTLLLNRMFQKYILKAGRIKKLSILEEMIQPDRRICQRIQDEKPDLVLASPFIFSRSTTEMEYVKCAQKLKIPTSVSIFSWDNLTSKGVFQIMPESVLVWNEKQLEELENIHDVDRCSAMAVGAPSLDGWFSMKASRSFADFCRQNELPKKPFILYLCSSQTIAPDEDRFVDELVNYINSSLADDSPTVIIRPHPLNIDIWRGWDKSGTAIIPKSNRDIFYSRDAKQLMYDSIYHSSSVLGLNTTAMIETAIIGRPCLTIVADIYANTQEMSGHFHHLIDAGFMPVSRTMSDIARHVKDAVSGRDELRLQREAFVHDFVRPFGTETSSSAIFAEVLVLLAEGRKLVEIKELMAKKGGMN